MLKFVAADLIELAGNKIEKIVLTYCKKTECKRCKGTGAVLAGDGDCPACKGKGR